MRVHVLVDANGNVEQVELIEGLSQQVGLNEAVIKAARQARFDPAVKNGVPVRMWKELSVRFEP